MPDNFARRNCSLSNANNIRDGHTQHEYHTLQQQPLPLTAVVTSDPVSRVAARSRAQYSNHAFILAHRLAKCAHNTSTTACPHS